MKQNRFSKTVRFPQTVCRFCQAWKSHYGLEAYTWGRDSHENPYCIIIRHLVLRSILDLGKGNTLDTYPTEPSCAAHYKHMVNS